MKKSVLLISIMISVLLVGVVSAGLFDSIKRTITGKALSQDTNVTVNVVGATQVNITVDNSTLSGGVTPVEDSSNTVNVYATVCDPDGVNDINDSATTVSYYKSGETTRSGSCSLVGDLDAYCANFSCSADLYYWDGYGVWNSNLTANDLGNQTPVSNTSFTFNYQLLRAMVIDPNQINWSAISPGDTDAKADNDPTTINNTGNYDGTLNVTGLDLYGLSTTTEVFGVDNFTAGIADDCATSGVYLANASSVLVTSSDANPGNLTSGGGAGQEELHYCIPTVPLLSSQQYSTDQQGEWTIIYTD
mgnify:CR=1 FL=1